jgi:hypothetical protein
MRAAWVATVLALTLASPASACEFTEDDWPALRRMVVRVKIRPETEAWAEHRTREGAQVQYLLSLDQPVRRDGRCWWPVEVRADGKLWKRFLVRPDDSQLLEDDAPREPR